VGLDMWISDELNGLLRTFEYRTPRMQARFPIWLHVEGEENRLIAAICSDLNDRGLGADVERSLPLNSMVTLVLPSPGSGPFILRARVASRQNQRYGFVFVPETPEDANEVATAVRTLLGSKRGAASEGRLLTGTDKRRAV
jgi:hypothetical protein